MDTDAVMSISVKALLSSVIGGVLTFVVTGGAVLWAVLSFTIGGMREDVGDIRKSLGQAAAEVHAIGRESILRSNEINKNLSDQIQGLRVDFVKLDDRLDLVVNKFDTSLTLITNKFDASFNKLSDRLDLLTNKFDTSFNKLDTSFGVISVRLEAYNNSMESLAIRLEKFQSQLTATSSQEIDTKRIAALVESLKQAGLDGQKIVIIPLPSAGPIPPTPIER
jgi:uncharacterized coiled-coil protein SlyX